MTVVDEQVRTSAYAVEVRTPAPLIRAAKNALVCASTEAHIPVICSVQVHFDGEVLEVQSTDRYLALYEQVDVNREEGAPVSEPWRFLLPRAAVPQALTFLKSVPRSHPVTVSWEPATDQDWSTGTVRLSSYESSINLSAIDSEPPRLRALFPKAENRVATEMTGFRRSIIQGIGKIESENKDPIVRISLFGSTRAQRIDWPGERRTLLVMAARIHEDVREWGVPGL